MIARPLIMNLLKALIFQAVVAGAVPTLSEIRDTLSTLLARSEFSGILEDKLTTIQLLRSISNASLSSQVPNTVLCYDNRNPLSLILLPYIAHTRSAKDV